MRNKIKGMKRALTVAIVVAFVAVIAEGFAITEEPALAEEPVAAGEASVGIPESIADRELIVFYDPRYAESLTFRSDGSLWWTAEGEARCLGSIDAVRQASASVYALRIGELDLSGADGISWLLSGCQPGDEILVALPNADPSELNGNIAPTVEQDYNGYDAEYEPADYYIGTVIESGELWFQPFEYWDYQ